MTASVTAIVLNWCNEADTAACLQSLAASRCDALTILLVDNGSPDGSGPRLHARFPEIPYLQTGTNRGYAGGNNAGFAWALARGAEYVLVLNDDTLIDPDCIARLVATATETGAAVVAPQIVYYDEPSLVWYGGGVFSTKRALGLHLNEDGPVSLLESPEPASFVCGCCFLIARNALEHVGGFDESFFAYVEDAELSIRLTRAGYTMMYEPRAIVQHRIKRGAVATPFQVRQRERNRRRLVARHYAPVERLRFAAWFYPTRLVHLARHALKREWSHAAAILDGTFGPLEGTAPTPPRARP